MKDTNAEHDDQIFQRTFTKRSPCRHKPITSPCGPRTSATEQPQGSVHPETARTYHQTHSRAWAFCFPATLTIEETHADHGKKKKAHSVQLETNLPSTMFICSASYCLSRLHSASRAALCIAPPLVSSDFWKRGVSHSFSAASPFIIPAGCLSCVIEGWFLFMYSSPTPLASPSRA